MADLINRRALLAALDCGRTRNIGVRQIVNAAPTVDAAQVVRCRDCRYAAPIPERARTAYMVDRVKDCFLRRGDWNPTYSFSLVANEGYCDEGEKRMDADHIVDANKMDADATERDEERDG